MIADALDILNPREKFTAEGTYWNTRPDTAAQGGGQKFNFEYVDVYSSQYRRLFRNMQSYEAGEVAIRTNDTLNYTAEGYFMTQDGTLFRIIQVAKDYQAASKQALRLLGTPLGTEYVLRAVSVENPWGVK